MYSACSSMYLLHAVYVTRVTRTIDTGTCTYHPFAMVPVRYLAYGPYDGMTPFVVREKSRGKNSGTNDDFFRIVPRTHKYLHNWTRSYIFVMKSSGSMFHIYIYILLLFLYGYKVDTTDSGLSTRTRSTTLNLLNTSMILELGN